MIPDSVLARLGEQPDEVAQAVALLRAGGVDDAEQVTLADGDRRLLELHRAVTGGDVELALRCPGCECLNSVTISADSLPARRPRSAWWGPGGGLREPTYQDLRGLPGDAEKALGELLARCTVGHPPRPATPVELAGVDDALTGPLQLSCVGCAEAMAVDLDVQHAVLARLTDRARQVDVEVHLLARSYGWDLAVIEALPDRRRRTFVALIREGV